VDAGRKQHGKESRVDGRAGTARMERVLNRYARAMTRERSGRSGRMVICLEPEELPEIPHDEDAVFALCALVSSWCGEMLDERYPLIVTACAYPAVVDLRFQFHAGRFTLRTPAHVRASVAARTMHARVWFERRDRIGNVVHCTFLRADHAGTQRKSAPVVLVIDDEQHERHLFEAFLRLAGWEVHTADDGRAGIAEARRLKPDVISLDVIMPIMDGWTALMELGHDPETAHIPVCIVTTLEAQHQAYVLGAADFLAKPVDRVMYVDAIRKLVPLP
jgi:CheY-like chemotaxis protein